MSLSGCCYNPAPSNIDGTLWFYQPAFSLMLTTPLYCSGFFLQTGGEDMESIMCIIIACSFTNASLSLHGNAI